MTYYSSMTRAIEVSCVWCGAPAGRVSTTDIGEVMLWIKEGKLCQRCYEHQEEVRETC